MIECMLQRSNYYNPQQYDDETYVPLLLSSKLILLLPQRLARHTHLHTLKNTFIGNKFVHEYNLLHVQIAKNRALALTPNTQEYNPNSN